MSAQLEVLDLDALDKPVGQVKIGGRIYDVLPANGVGADLLQQLATRPNGEIGALSYIDIARQITAETIPKLSADDRQRLGVEKLTLIVGMATGNIEKVRVAIQAIQKNGQRPTAGAGRSTDSRPQNKGKSPGRK